MSLYIMVKYNNYIYKIIKGFLYFFKINNLLGILIEFYRDKVIGCWLSKVICVERKWNDNGFFDVFVGFCCIYLVEYWCLCK